MKNWSFHRNKTERSEVTETGVHRKHKSFGFRLLGILAVLAAMMLLFTGCEALEVADYLLSEQIQYSQSVQSDSFSEEKTEQKNSDSSKNDKQSKQENSSKNSSDSKQDNSSKKTEYRYYFRNNKLLSQHYEKHGIEMGFSSKEAYEEAASDVINNPDALHKIEKEDGDEVYYVEDSNEFVILSQDGYIRTYFLPSAGKKYYDRQ